MTVFPHPWEPRPADACGVLGCKEPRHWYLTETGREQCRRWCADHAVEYDFVVQSEHAAKEAAANEDS